MSPAELRVENQQLRQRLHEANARIAALEGKQGSAPLPKDATDRSREMTHKKIDTVKQHG